MREKLSYLQIRKTTTMCYMYAANYSDYDSIANSVAK